MSAKVTAALAGPQKAELLLFFTLLELTIIVLAGRLAGAIARRYGQSAAVGEIIVGILLGPSLFGWLAPDTFAFVFHSAPPQTLSVLSNLGLVLLMFQIGTEFDFAHLTLRSNRAAVLRVSIACLALPFASGFVLGLGIAPADATQNARLDTALFVATAFSITALPILGRIMLELGLSRTRLGVIAISSAAVNDVIGWLLLALITALTASEFDPGRLALKVLWVALFVLVSCKVVRPLLKLALRASAREGAAGSARAGAGAGAGAGTDASVSANSGISANSRAGARGLSPNLLGGMLGVIFLGGMATSEIGIFAIFGGFMMGVILYDEPEFVAAWRDRVGHFVTVFFLPIFFTYTGLRTAIGGLDTAADWGWCAAIVAGACFAKLLGAYWASRRSGFDHVQSAMIGVMMNTRALMELIVVNVGYDLGVISQKLFTMLVIMAIVSTVITTPMLRHYMPRAGFRLPDRRRTEAMPPPSQA